MTRSEIGEIVFDLCRGYGVEVDIMENMPYSEITEERIVIILSRIEPSTYWENTMVKINWCVPDISNEANSIRLKEIEPLLKPLFRGCGTKGDDTYRYSKDSTDTGENADMRCHFANLTLLFQTLNIN